MEQADGATSVPGLVESQACARHDKLYSRPFSQIAWFIKKA
jgi:hypothetical protein